MDINNVILDKMQDKLSKDIYTKRIDYNNGKKEAIEELITLRSEGKELVEFMEAHKAQLYIFGAGAWGRELQKTWGWKYKFCAYIDNNKNMFGKFIEDVPVISLNEVKQSLNCDHAGIIISTRLYWREVLEQLIQCGMKTDHLYNMGKIQDDLSEKQYFDLEYLDKNTNEIFVDIGAFDGKTSIELYKWYAGNVRKIYLFEPDKRNIVKCRENLNSIKTDYEIINKGVWSESQVCNFRPEGNGTSCITQDGEQVIEVIRLDDFFKDKEATFIKMDIEGAELKALEGAENLIRNAHPKFAICVYHKNEDIDQIPRLLLEYYPEYRFYLRHYSVTKAETVLYAI